MPDGGSGDWSPIFTSIAHDHAQQKEHFREQRVIVARFDLRLPEKFEVATVALDFGRRAAEHAASRLGGERVIRHPHIRDR